MTEKYQSDRIIGQNELSHIYVVNFTSSIIAVGYCFFLNSIQILICFVLFVLQNHLLSVFDNTRTVTFDEKIYDKILSINSQEGETVQLEEPVMTTVCFSFTIT